MICFCIDCVFPQLVWTLGPWQTVPQWRPSLREAGEHLEPSQRNPWTAFSAQSWTKWLLMVSVGDQAPCLATVLTQELPTGIKNHCWLLLLVLVHCDLI